MPGQRFVVLPTDPSSVCRSCGATIFWIITKNGKKMPVNEDGTSHFATCEDRDYWRKPR